MQNLVPSYPKPPAHIIGFIDILGPDLTVKFLLAFGGAELSLSADPKGKSKLEKLVGYDNTKALWEICYSKTRIPLAKPWTAAYLHSKGKSVAEIARTLHSSDVSVRNWVNTARKHKSHGQ